MEKGKLDVTMPDDCFCPITLNLIQDPVVAADGFTYEKYAIKHWLKKHNTSPLTGQKLKNKVLTPNLTLKHVIEDFKKKVIAHKQTIHKYSVENKKQTEKIAQLESKTNVPKASLSVNNIKLMKSMKMIPFELEQADYEKECKLSKWNFFDEKFPTRKLTKTSSRKLRIYS